MRRVLPPLLFALGAVVFGGCQAEAEPADDDVTEDALTVTFRGARAQALDVEQKEIDAIGYDVDLALDDAPNAESFRATVKGTYVAKKATTELRLDFAGNAIDSVKAMGRTATFRRDGDVLVIALGRTVAAGKVITTEIAYHGAPAVADGANPNDFEAYGGLMVKRRNAAGQRIFTSLSWPRKARRWLPLRDHPSDGAMLAMKVTAPSRYTVVANGKRTSTVDGGATRTWQYEALVPMPTYDFHVTAYDGFRESESRSDGGIPVHTYVYAPHEAAGQRLLGEAPKALDYYASTFGSYRWGQLSYLEEPIFGGGMEHASVVSMDETLFSSPASSRTTTFHELAHHWSGNLVRIGTWNDFWLSEGITDYLTRRFVAAHDGEAAGRALWRETLARAIGDDLSHPLRPAGDDVDVLAIFDDVSYKKGAFVARALEHELGTDAFTAALRRWFDDNAGKARTSADLQAHLERAGGKPLAGFFRGFVYGTGHPEVRAKVAGGELVIEQLQSDEPFAFTLDVEVALAAGGAARVAVPVTGREARAPLPAGAGASPALSVDPDGFLLGLVACDASAPCANGATCRRSSRGVHSVCSAR